MRTHRGRKRSRRGARGWSRQPFAVGALVIGVALILGLGGGLAIGWFWNGEALRLAARVAPAAVPVVPSEKPFQTLPRTETPPSEPPAPTAMSEPPARPTWDAPAWKRFAAPPPPIDGRAMIAIVIDDLGLDRPRTRRAIALPAPLTLAFLPYARGLPELASKARGAGHEILVHMPMEPDSG